MKNKDMIKSLESTKTLVASNTSLLVNASAKIGTDETKEQKVISSLIAESKKAASIEGALYIGALTLPLLEVNANYITYNYGKKRAILNKFLNSFVDPRPIPVQHSHDTWRSGTNKAEIVGRVLAATHYKDKDKEAIYTGQVITEQDTIDRIMNMIDYSQSIGVKVSKAICSHCGEDRLMPGNSCDHYPGDPIMDEKDKLVGYVTFDAELDIAKENSFVAQPAFTTALVKAIEQNSITTLDLQKQIGFIEYVPRVTGKGIARNQVNSETSQDEPGSEVDNSEATVFTAKIHSSLTVRPEESNSDTIETDEDGSKPQPAAESQNNEDGSLEPMTKEQMEALQKQMATLVESNQALTAAISNSNKPSGNEDPANSEGPDTSAGVANEETTSSETPSAQPNSIQDTSDGVANALNSVVTLAASVTRMVTEAIAMTNKVNAALDKLQAAQNADANAETGKPAEAENAGETETSTETNGVAEEEAADAAKPKPSTDNSSSGKSEEQLQPKAKPQFKSVFA